MAVNFRQALNRVLRILGEPEISTGTSSLSSDYEKLVAAFFNSIKEEVEDAHNWRAMRQEHTATIAANTRSGAVTGATERSRLVRVQDARFGILVPLVYDVTDPSDPVPLQEVDIAWLLHQDETDPDLRTDEPSFFAVDNAAEDTINILVWPRPRTERTLSVHMFTPQARLGDDDLDVNIKVPVRPIEVGTLWYALEERGEELGINSLFSEQRYRKALDDAIARDSAEAGDSYELIPQ